MAANNPVQVVLNDSDYIIAPEAGTGGPPTDFFPGRDTEFAAHRQKLKLDCALTAAALMESPGEGFGYVRVKLREEALAKSHRPTQKLLPESRYPCVGAGGLGELFFMINAADLMKLTDVIDRADVHTNWVRNKDDKLVARPNQERSEVGAVESISIPDPKAKRTFDAQAAVSWLDDRATGGGYIVELFEFPNSGQAASGISRGALAKSLEDLVREFGLGTAAWRLKPAGNVSAIALRVGSGNTPPVIGRAAPERASSRQFLVDPNPARHQGVLDRLAAHPLVRHISLPLKLELSNPEAFGLNAPASLSTRDPEAHYPIVGVIDSGLSPALAPWIEGRHDLLDEDELDQRHGTFVGGLLVDGSGLNPAIPSLEADGCRLVDLGLYPKDDFFDTYPRGFDDFLEELEQAVIEAKANHGVKVFNMSINAVSAVESDRYSYYAARLDDIALRHDVIFVNSAGNLPFAERRAAWPVKAKAALKYFADRVEADTIFKPAESYQVIAVGAVNPPNCDGHDHGLPTTYTRRGPGLKVGCKPDVAHYGGSEAVPGTGQHGLCSVGVDGTKVSGCGTSYAAPLVAKHLATLDAMIEADLPTHALKALLVHSCQVPASLSNARLRNLSRQFVGFGVPATAGEMLVTDDHSMTMVFTSRLPDDEKRPKVLRFPFAWPQSLVDPVTGACFGEAQVTLVYEPPVDVAFGAEFVRINLDAKLQQRQPKDRQDGKPSFRCQLDQVFLPKTANQPVPEKELINQGLKWWPTKRYQARLPSAGLGSSSEWRVEVAALRRAGVTFPAAGVPFSLIVTIRDPNQSAPIFQELRRSLRGQLVSLGDIRTQQRIRSGT